MISQESLIKTHSTNYENTFIEIAEDCTSSQGEIPPLKGDKKSVANLQFEMLRDKPYQYTSDNVFFAVFAIRKDLIESELEAARLQFFAKGQPCFRTSPLTKRYGWGVHSNAAGKVALYGVESSEYQRFVADNAIVKVTAMRTKRK